MKTTRLSQLALAAAATLAAFGANAQSTVNVYGLIDMSVDSVKASGNGKTRQTLVESGNMTTSYYGFSGSEDLGNGLSAQFKLEGFFKANSGSQGRAGTDNQFSRTASVGLSHKDYGTINLGRNTTALFVSTLSFNAFGDSFGYSPSIRHYFGGLQNAVTGDTGWSESIAYSSPVWSGFRFGLSAAAKGTSNGGNWGANIGYSKGPLAAALVVQDVKKSGILGGDADTKTTQLNASYDFGVAKVFGQYAQVENTTTGIDSDLTHLGVRVPAGPGAVIAQWGHNAPDLGADRVTTSVGYLYPLSKRTEVYAVAMHDKKANEASGSAYSLGVRMRF